MCSARSTIRSGRPSAPLGDRGRLHVPLPDLTAAGLECDASQQAGSPKGVFGSFTFEDARESCLTSGGRVPGERRP